MSLEGKQQLDAAEAIILGLDCVVMAGTGAERTIPFTLLLFSHNSRDEIILIPAICASI
jgi:hypothetical protein